MIMIVITCKYVINYGYNPNPGNSIQTLRASLEKLLYPSVIGVRVYSRPYQEPIKKRRVGACNSYAID